MNLFIFGILFYIVGSMLYIPLVIFMMSKGRYCKTYTRYAFALIDWVCYRIVAFNKRIRKFILKKTIKRKEELDDDKLGGHN